MDDADVVIVGGGPAGLSTALFLVASQPRLAERIVVLERDRYPRDKPCAGGLGGRADRALARIGVRVDVESAPVRGVAVSLRGGRVTRRERGEEVVGRVVRRAAFDARLAEVAVSRGIRLVEGVRALRVESHPLFARVHTDRGTLRARFVVGADGVGSVVRRALGPRERGLHAQVVEVDTPPLTSDPARDVLHFDATDGALPGYAWDFPVPGDASLVCRGAYVLKVPGAAALDAGAVLDRHLRRLGIDPAGLPRKRYAERAFSARAKLADGRILLVGEAAGVDPVSGEGIAQAIAYGELAGPFLAERIVRGEALTDGWARRVAASALGLDLHGREQVARLFFGTRRAFYEASLFEAPEMLELGLRYFGGLRLDPRRALRVAGVGLRLEAHDAVRRGLAGLRSRIGLEQQQIRVPGTDDLLVAEHHCVAEVPTHVQLTLGRQRQREHLIVKGPTEALAPAVHEVR
jgi:menaquinone-9 beta-reductase